MKFAKKKILYVFWAMLYALWILSLTQSIFWSVADSNVFYATILNFVFIFLMLIWDRMEDLINAKLKPRDSEEKIGIFRKIFVVYTSGASFKSGMYFFYIFITVYTALLAADPDFFLQIYPDYLQSVRYGILLLIAADKFMDQIVKDLKSQI